MEIESDIVKWYRGKNIFITGATGFMGKVLVEKLLRSCPEVGPIYILIRQKKNVDPRDRVKKLMTYAAFDKVRAEQQHRKNWICAIPGDIGLPDMGISDEDRRLLHDQVSVVFHLAATVRFDEPLRMAMSLNVDGTRTLLEMCQGMKKLSVFVHVSTAYANCIIPIIDERIYPPPANVNVIKDYIARRDDDVLEKLTPSLIGDHPNTYTFTKALAEHVVEEYAKKLPIIIVRPSIVTSSWREPLPGWIDNFNGPAGLGVAAGKGIMKVLYGQGDDVVDLIPVDICINLCIAAAWEHGSKDGSKLSSDVLVYNCVTRPFNPITWNRFLRVTNECTTKYIMSDIFMHPGYEITHCKVNHDLIKALRQTLPAVVADLIMKSVGQKPRFKEYQSQLDKMMAKLRYFMTNEWTFKSTNVMQLKQRLSSVDRKIFDFDATKMNWTEYLQAGFLGLRRYLLKDSDDTLPAAKRSLARRVLLTKALQCALLLPASYAILTFWGVSLSGLV